MSAEAIPAPKPANLPTKEDIWEMVGHFDPQLDGRRTIYRVGTILLTSVIVGPDIEKILTHLGLQGSRRWEAKMRQAAKRFIKQGIWKDGQVRVEWKFHLEMTDDECFKNVLAFWLDAGVGAGQMERVYDEGEIKYQMAGSVHWKLHYILLEQVIPKHYKLQSLKEAGIVSVQQLIYAVHCGQQNDMIDVARDLFNRFPNLPIPEAK